MVKTNRVGESSSRVCSILADICTSMINIPIPKTHSTFTCSLKNHFGTIDIPRSFHPDSCTNPGIPEVNATELGLGTNNIDDIELVKLTI